MNDVMKTNAQLPAHLQGVVGKEVFDEFAGGVQSGFPIISYRGKVWRVRKGGEEQVNVDDDGNAMPTIEVVLLRSNERPSKTYYETGYNEGDNAKPRCWSSDGVKPDSVVPDKVSALCAPCPMNVWGSKTTEQGKATRACQDVRRVAVCFIHQLEEAANGTREQDDVDILLLRVPPASLNPLKDYAETVLKPKGIPPYVLSTKIGFDADAPYPRFTFKGARFLNEQEFEVASALRNSDESKRVLNESLEHDEEGSTEGGDQAAVAGQPQQKSTPSAPSPASKKKAKKKTKKATPVSEPEPPRAADVEASNAQAEEVEDIAAPTSSKKASGTDAKFEDMLDSILG